MEKYGLQCILIPDKDGNLHSASIDRYPNLKIKFSTIHRSKGLEADYVIVLNLNNEKHGFPSKIEDDPVISLVLPIKDQYPYEEERRLFYVAITRTRNKIYLLTNVERQSVFISEIKEYPDIMLRADITQWIPTPGTCPRCGKYLVTKFRKNGKSFIGCPGYPECTYTG